MSVLPAALQDLIDAFGSLPGVGPRTAERYAYHLLKKESIKTQRLARRLDALHQGVAYCPVTFALMDPGQEVSQLYADPKRDKTLIAIVEDSLDVVAIEKIGHFTGTYHVLGGVISPIDGMGPEQLNTRTLIARIQQDAAKEVIIATNASVEGESTALYLQRFLADANVKISRLARGLPVGTDLEYADHITLSRAFEGRQVMP